MKIKEEKFMELAIVSPHLSRRIPLKKPPSSRGPKGGTLGMPIGEWLGGHTTTTKSSAGPEVRKMKNEVRYVFRILIVCYGREGRKTT
ncbi:hypothetical protein CEXT_512501 [Caerostris extrusa]|uniref:Uncharacterized protein n=1 Tax=Caerostris extrusa TaxID=172846 RepID=A0AAV4UT69_CAEEX|nr:hypothetical protein CEXT_512501 [Caerostris extrusa]